MNEIKEFISQYDNETVLYVILGFLVLNYVIALYKSYKGTITAISGWFDLFLVLIPVLGLIIIMFITKENDDAYNNNLFLFYGIVSGIAIIWTLINSIISNRDNLLNIPISFFSKIFVMLISALIIFFVFGGSNSKKDGRFKDGTKGNSHTKWKAMLAAIAGFLIFSLVSNKRKNVISTVGEHIYKKG